MKKLLLCCLVAVCLVLIPAATASAGTPTLKSLARTVAALQKKVNGQATKIATLTTGLAATKQTVSAQASTIASQATTIDALGSDLAAATTSIVTLTGDLDVAEQTLGTQGATLVAAAPVLAMAPYVSVDTKALNGLSGPHIIFQGANVHVRSMRDWDATTGVGNLIVGWDEAYSDPAPVRTGANNLVVGPDHSFTNSAGLLAGYGNTVSSYAGSALGGMDNSVIGAYCTVVGGNSNTSGTPDGLAGYATVVGGVKNTASGTWGSVLGGGYNAASGASSTVVGGYYNTAGSYGSSVAGGSNLVASGSYGWFAGNTATTGVAKYSAP